jgi:hypothetical protein
MKRIAIALFVATVAASGQARVFMTQQEALAGAFPAGSAVERESVFLTPQQVTAARGASGVEFDDRLVVRYVARRGGQVIGYAYFDTHRVRTLAETVMIVVDAESRLQKVEILSFKEPPDYLPKRRWLDQLHGARLDDELSLKRAIRPISGASLSGRAIVNASRKVLALHRVIAAAAPAAAARSAGR